MTAEQERNSVYLGALLHDIGKFIERAKRQDFQFLAKSYHHRGEASLNYAHKRYSAAFIREHLFPRKLVSDSAVESYVLWHHRGNEPGKDDYEPIRNKGVLLSLIRMADDFASAERREDAALEPQKYHLARLQSVFSDIQIRQTSRAILETSEKRYLDVQPLSETRESCFPLSASPVFTEQPQLPYLEPLHQFLESADRLRDIDELQPLLLKYLHSVPAQTPTEFNGKQHLSRPDISLYDHLSATAAIAVCLYDEYHAGCWKDRDEAILSGKYREEDFPSPCVLVSGNISGIQDFIFDIPSRGAAKALKGRSFFVQLLSEVCVRLILDRINLKPVNLLFNGGGNFFILAPGSSLPAIMECRRMISSALLRSGLYVSIGHSHVSAADFLRNRFSLRWSEAHQSAERDKSRRFSALEAAEVFSPFSVDQSSQVDMYGDLALQLRTAKGYRIVPHTGSPGHGWQEIFNTLGYAVEFSCAPDGMILLGDTSFEGNASGFRFYVKGFPVWEQDTIKVFSDRIGSMGRKKEVFEEDENPIVAGSIKTFAHLAAEALAVTGTSKLGVLKIDVDNLGKIFSEGLPEQLRSVSRMMSLSRNLQWFFEGHVNELLRDPRYAGFLYVIFSGGDDFFLVGSWNKVFEFALDVQNSFCEFTANPALTISAALLVVDDHYPVSRFAETAEQRLHEAKYSGTGKNAVSVFDEILSWNEFSKAQRIKDLLVSMVREHGESKAVIQKVLRGCRGLTALYRRARLLHEASVKNDTGKLRLLDHHAVVPEKIWRMNYFLRNMKSAAGRSLADELLKEYEETVQQAMRGEMCNPSYIAVGARWAELSLRRD